MIELILGRFRYVRELKEEVDRLTRALESAARYGKTLEAVKEHQAERIRGLEEDVRLFGDEIVILRNLKGGSL